MKGTVLAAGEGSHIHQEYQPYQNIYVASPSIALLLHLTFRPWTFDSYRSETEIIT